MVHNVRTKTINLGHIASNSNLADIMNKTLSPEYFITSSAALMNPARCSTQTSQTKSESCIQQGV